MRRWLNRVIWRNAVVGMAAIGCSSRGDASAPEGDAKAARTSINGTSPKGQVVELFSWWARTGNLDVLGALMQEHHRRFPRENAINASAELSGLARKTLRERLLRGEPPDSFQANVGFDLMQWVKLNQVDAGESRLLPLDSELPNIDELRRNVPATIIALLSYDGKLYGVPATVHRINTVYYNKHVLLAHGLDEPKTLDELKNLGRQLKRANVPLFALGSREPWTLALLVFECLLVSQSGRGFYEDFFRGSLRPDDPRIRATLETALELLDYANPDHAQLSYRQATELVVRGQAAMTVMGDWDRVAFDGQGMRLGVDYEEKPFPGTSDTFVFTSDAFALPRNSKNKPGGKRILETIASREGQGAIVQAKRALAARLDVPPIADSVFLAKHRLLAQGSLVLALSGLVSQQFADDIGHALAEMVREHDPEPVILTLRSRYPLLR